MLKFKRLSIGLLGLFLFSVQSFAAPTSQAQSGSNEKQSPASAFQAQSDSNKKQLSTSNADSNAEAEQIRSANEKTINEKVIDNLLGDLYSSGPSKVAGKSK